MKRGLVVVSVLLALVLFMTSGAAAGKRRGKVPPVPEIPSGVLPSSLEIPAEAEALVTQPGSVEDAFRLVVAFLQLTPEQASALRDLMRNRHQTIAPLVQEIHARQEQIIEQLNSGAPDPTVIGQLVIEIHQLLQQIYQAQQAFLGAFEGLLNEEQRQRYHAIRLADLLQPFVPAFRLLRLL